MKSARRVIAAIISAVIVLSSVSFCAFAAGETGSVTFKLSSSSPTGNNPGDIITITINIANDYNATAFRWPIAFSNTVFELYDGGSGNVGNVTSYGSLAATGSSLTAIDKSGDDNFHNSSFAKNRYGMLLIQWIGGQNNGTANYYNEPTGSDCITFQLRVKDNPSASTGVVVVPLGNPYSTYWYKQGIANPNDATTYYKISDSNFTITNTQAQARTSVGVYTLPAGIQAKNGTDIIITEPEDHPDVGEKFGFIYGFTAVASNSDYPFDDSTNDMCRYVETTGGAVAVYTPAEGSSGHGTGTYVEVYTGTEYGYVTDNDASTNGTPFETYYIVIFADIDGDTTVSASDMVMHLNAINYLYEWTYTLNPYDSPYYLACDINADGVVTGDDYGSVVDAGNGLGYINQTYSPSGYYIEF